MSIDDVTLSDGTRIPGIGLGTYSLTGDAGAASMAGALDIGYRLIDSAVGYENEDAVGEALRRSDVPREEIVVTTKLPGDDHGFEETLRSIDRSLATLGLDRIDLYLIHWPLPERDGYVDSWKAMIRARDEGSIRSIGVSNFDRAQLERLRHETGETPALNQVELHLGKPQDELRAAHAELGVVTEAYSPLQDHARWSQEPTVAGIARAHDVTANQVALRWAIQLGTVPIPRSKDAGRQAENLDVAGFELGQDEMAALTALR